MKTEAGANWNSRSMSDLGVIATNINFVVTSDNNTLDGSSKSVRFDGGYGAIGPMMFGWTDSTFDPGGGYTYDGAVRSDKKVDQFRLSYLMGTWGIMLGLEDPRDRCGSGLRPTRPATIRTSFSRSPAASVASTSAVRSRSPTVPAAPAGPPTLPPPPSSASSTSRARSPTPTTPRATPAARTARTHLLAVAMPWTRLR